MAKGISISIASDTRQFNRNVKSGVIEPLEDAAEVLQDVERAGDDAGDALERSMTDAQRKTDGLTDEFRTLQDKIDDASRKSRDFGDAGRRAGRDYEDGMDRAKAGVDDFRDEANSTAREAAASFDGSAESIGDAFQEIAANAFGGFGPAGAVAGLAAAAGIGLATAGFQQVQEAEEESKERAREWGQAYIEAGSTVLDSLLRASKAQDILADRGDELRQNAENWGVTQATALAAMTGETWALEAAESALVERERELEQSAQEYADAGGRAMFTQMSNQGAATEAGRTALERLNSELQGGVEDLDTYSQYLHEVADNTAGATREVDQFGDTVVTLPDGKQIYIDAETQRATDNVDAIERRIYGIPDGHATVRVGVDDSAVTAFMNRPLVKQMTVNAIVRPGERLWN